ncbi:hypothetical protein Q3395_18375, partial [Clostridioides difficile]
MSSAIDNIYHTPSMPCIPIVKLYLSRKIEHCKIPIFLLYHFLTYKALETVKYPSALYIYFTYFS